MRPFLWLPLIALFAVPALRADEPPGQAKPVRVLLMAAVGGREFQFVRTLLQRDAEKKAIVCTQLLQALGEQGAAVVGRQEVVFGVGRGHFEGILGRGSSHAEARRRGEEGAEKSGTDHSSPPSLLRVSAPLREIFPSSSANRL